jgi:hypothetical protein
MEERAERGEREPSAVPGDVVDLPRDERRRLVVKRPKGGETAPLRRVRGEGWRSVVSGAVVAGLLAGLAAWTDIPGERVDAVAPWLTLALVASLAGKDVGKLLEAVVQVARAVRGR